MKKIRDLLFAIILIILPINVMAAGSIKPSTSNLTITKGSSKTFTVKASNAVGRIDISSTNPSCASVDVSNAWLENNSITVKVTGINSCNSQIIVRLSDAATFDEEELKGSYTINVTVNDGNSNSGNNSSNTNNDTSSKKSKNTKLKSLSVKGYKLSENYELTVNNNVSELELDGETDDAKATITGLGKKKLEVGLNTFDIVVKAESGAKKTYTVKITRKDGFYLEDLEEALKEENVNIIINKENNITKDNLQKIKDSKKIVNLNYYNEEKNLLYSWIINGEKLNAKEFNPHIKFSSEFIKEIGKSSNYADGYYVSFAHTGELPTGTKVKLYVGDKFENDSVVNVYYYNEENENLETIKNDLLVKDGFIEFDINHCSDYFVTISTIAKPANAFNIFIIITIIETILIIGIIVLDIFKLNPLLKLNK